MGKDTEAFEQFCTEELSREPVALRQLIEGWEVLESRGNDEHRVLLLTNPQGEKRILKMFSHRQNARMRAEREALNAAKEPGIPRLYDFAEDDRYVYLLREYVEGQNLEEYVTARGLLDMHAAARIGAQLCRVLMALHRLGIIHRDVKPQNVIITPDGQAYLIDFDISRRYMAGGQHDTEYLGTRTSAPPEQFGYGQTDARTDIYSLGVVILYLMTGQYELADIDTLPRTIRRVVRRCTNFAPEGRYQTAAHLRQSLRAVETRRTRLWVTAVLMALVLALAVWGALTLPPKPHAYPALAVMAQDAQAAFAEPLIERCVRAQLNKAAGEPITFGEVQAVTELYLYGDYTDGVAHEPDYRGDKVYVNGTLINHGSVLDLSDLLMMPRLRVVRLFRQPVENVDALHALEKLEELYLDESPNVRDIAAVEGLQWLRTLDIGDTAVADLSPLRGCPRLRNINLERVPCTDFSVLARYAYLEFLNVNEAQPQAVMAAVQGKMIDYLWLDYAGLTDIEPFVRAESVERLHAKHNEIASLEGIEALTMLEYVDVAYNPITDLTPVLALPRLKALRIDPGMAEAWAAIADKATFAVEWEN
jgi:predicted Ser/Thr protein kinase